METYFDLGFGAYLTNLSVGILFLLLIVKLLDIFFKKKFSPGWRYVIAIAVTVFFLIPIKIETPWTVIPLLSLNFPLDIVSPDPILIDGVTEIGNYSTSARATVYFLYDYLIYIWAAGTAGTLLYQVIRLIRFSGSVRKKGIPCGNAAYKKLLGDICGEMKTKVPGLIIFPETDTPFAMGIFSPKIILPSGDFSENELEYIFRHEVCHIKHRDILMKLFLIIFRCMNWFNPLAYILVKNVFADMEIACDERTCKGFSADRREDYSRTLLKGASKMKCPAVTTYLSPNARIIKNRIDAVMNVRKFGKAIPFTIAFTAVFMLSQTYCAMYDDTIYGLYLYTDPYPMEADPYITADEWRTAEGSNAAEAAKKIFRQYMEMYMGEDVPEYYRVEDYFIGNVRSYDNAAVDFENVYAIKGLLNPHEYVNFNYSFIPANKCGNTVHNCNFGMDVHLNGVYNHCTMGFELEKKGSSYTVVNMGTILMSGITPYHFSTVNTPYDARAMAQSGLLDYNWNDRDSLPAPDDICSCIYRREQLFNEYMSRLDPDFDPTDHGAVLPGMYFGNSLRIDEDYINTAGCVKTTDEGYREIDPEKVTFDEGRDFEYCGFDVSLEDYSAVIYGNVTGDDPHGVKLILYVGEDEATNYCIDRRLHEVEVTKELFTPVEFHDTFDNIPLPEGLTTAEEILEYMKTPRDSCDFTVLDYNSITEETDGTYANVCFKGRLDGQYSSDLKQDKNNDGYIRVRITGKGDPQQKGVSL